MFNQDNVTDAELAQARARAIAERERCEMYHRAHSRTNTIAGLISIALFVAWAILGLIT